MDRKNRVWTVLVIGMLLSLLAGTATQAKWVTNAKGTRYRISKQKGFAKGPVKINGKQYYFDQNGFMQTSTWVKVKKKYYYFQENGQMATSTWVGPYRVGKSGARTGKVRSPGLTQSGKKLYYLDENFEKVRGWVTVDGRTYYFGGAKSAARTGIQTIDGVTYCFDENGVMQTGWQTLDKKSYYFDELGIMVRGITLQLNGITCEFDEFGVCVTSGAGQTIAQYALQFLGSPYVYGGTSLTDGADCSGFIYALMGEFGIRVPRTADDQRRGKDTFGKYTKSVTVKPKPAYLMPGDLVFYGTKKPKYSDHVALYIGNGKVIHASTPETGVIISDYDYHRPIAARRYWYEL